MIQSCKASNDAVIFLWLVSHMTVLELQSDWHMQIPLRIVNWTKLFAQSRQTLFGLGTRLLLCTMNCSYEDNFLIISTEMY